MTTTRCTTLFVGLTVSGLLIAPPTMAQSRGGDQPIATRIDTLVAPLAEVCRTA